MTATSPSGTPLIISVLSLVVAILAVFVARSNVQRQIQVTARETWMREFREQVAALLTSETALSDELKKHLLDTPERRLAESKIRDAMTSSYNTIRLLLAEKGQQHEAFGGAMDRFMVPPEAAAALWHRQVFTAAAANILRRERAAIEAPVMMERTLRSRLGAVGGQPWSRLWAWLRRDPPRFPDLP